MRYRALNYLVTDLYKSIDYKTLFLIKEKETNECDEDTEFTVPWITVFFGRYDNESPPLLMFFLR